jgi:hypothetical protein
MAAMMPELCPEDRSLGVVIGASEAGVGYLLDDVLFLQLGGSLSKVQMRRLLGCRL